MAAIQVNREDALNVLLALGFKTAPKWNKPRMTRKLGEVIETAQDDGIQIEEDERLNGILQGIIGCPDGFELVDGDAAPQEPEREEKVIVEEPEKPEKVEPKKGAATKTKSMSRFMSTLLVVKEMGQATSLEDLARSADDLYVQNGGTSNLVRSMEDVMWAVKAAQVFGLVEREKKTVTPVS